MNNDATPRILAKASDPTVSIHLSASAGSGKTRALKDRYLALLDILDNRGLNIDQAVAITFTDKAAAEIKDRVMHDLPEPMLKKIIRGRQDLRISTIHSFCMNILKRYPLEAGVPPDFGVLDARDQADKIQKAVEDALEEADRDPELMDPLGNFSADDLIMTVDFLLSIRSKLKRMEIDAAGPDNLLQTLWADMGAEKTETELEELITAPAWRMNFSRMESVLGTQGGWYDRNAGTDHRLLAETQDARSIFRIATSLAPLYFTADGKLRKNPSIPKKAFTGVNRDEYEKTYYALQQMLARFHSLYGQINASREALSLLRLFQRAEENYQDAKLREGLLDFDDLEIYAYRLLQGQESMDILYWLDRKILHFLVDEFQDTSDIQWAILNKLTAEIFAGQGTDKPVSPTLFVVGDEKQSIYRFREANYRLIENVRARMEERLPPEACQILTLHRNFRSTPQVVETVNGVFARLWDGAYQPSEAHRTGQAGSVRLLEILPGTDRQEGTVLTESEALACEIRGLIESGTVIYDLSPVSRSRGSEEGGWTERRAGYGDCAILIQSRTKLKEHEAALQKYGIPFRVVGGIGFYEEEEIQALLNVLYFLWNREDLLSLAAALKSPLFGLSDTDIFELRQADGNLLDALRVRKPVSVDMLQAWGSIAGLVPLSSLIHTIVGDTGAYVRFGRRNPQAIFNIDKLLDTAREFDRRGYTTLQDFVIWVKNIRSAEQREAAADMTLPGFQGAVSIMTVHKAKGLEFPVVFLPGMNQQPRSITTGPPVIVECDAVTRMAVKDAANPLYGEMWEREKDELRREHQRLLYVAMTRARDHLVMIGTLNEGKHAIQENTWLNYLHAASPQPLFTEVLEPSSGIRRYTYPEAPGIVCGIPVPPSSSRERDGQNALRQFPLRREDIQQLVATLAPIPPSQIPEWKKATDFIDHDTETELALLSTQTTAGAASSLTRGSVLHRCLEEYTKTGSCAVDRILTEFSEIADAAVAQELANDVGTVLNKVMKDPSLTWVFERSSKSYSELPFLCTKGDSIVSGIIDRLVIRDNIGYVVDYKAILVENEKSLAAWKDHYRPQIRIYCEAAQEIFKLSAVHGYLLFLDSGRLELVHQL